MWISLAIAFASLALGLQFYWWTRCQRLRSEAGRLRREKEALESAAMIRREEELAHQSAVFDSMIEGVLILDSSRKIQIVNATFRRLFQLEGEVADRSILEVVRLHELQELVDRLDECGRVTEFELQTNLPGGTVFQVNAVALSGTSGPAGAMLVFHDVSRINQLENLRKDFVANVSHELRTPLSMIKGYVETLLDGAKDTPEVAAKFLKIIEKHADRLTFLIEDLLTISSLESGQIRMNLQPVEIGAAVERVVEELRGRAAARETRVVMEDSGGLVVSADPSRLQQVLFNLIDNGIKYGKAGGQIRVQAGAADGRMIRVTIADDGPGIPPEAVERIFERFYRVDKARSREQGGTGLGLAIVKHIIQAHGGEVWVESEPGKGAAFCFTLKAASLVT